MGTFYTPESCEQVRLSALGLHMQADPTFWKASPERLAEVMNGCGPDSWTDSLRCLASWVYRNFPEAIGIHDWDFEHSDGIPATLVKVNNRFHMNNKRKLNQLYPISQPWWYPARAIAWSKIQLAFVALKNDSLSAWISAHERYNPDPLEPLLS